MTNYMQKLDEKRQKLVNTLIEFIETNSTQWDAGWYSVASGTPINGKTQKKYNGLNAFYLMVLAIKHGYKDPRWITFNQAKELGANVKSGEKSSEVFYWSYYDKKTKKPFDERTVENMDAEERKQYLNDYVRPVLKFYQVFNAEQCENMPVYERPATPEMDAEERARQNAVIERIISNSAAPVNFDGGNKAYYSPSDDSIHLPEISAFKTMQDYYATALHEIAHSTGHESRLNRDLSGMFGKPAYAKEELRAELASVFMQVDYGISIEGKHFENHGAYLASWLHAVKNNMKEFFSAAADAEKISYYIADNYLQEHKEEINEQKPVFDEKSSFAKQVDEVLSGADTTSTHLKVMSTPLILRQLGAENLPVVMTARHLKNIVADSGNDPNVNYHGLDADLVKKLPELLADPVMVMDSMTRDDSVVVLTATVDKENRPVIGAIKFDGRGNLNDIEINANVLTSTYGKDNFNEFLQRNVDADTILYWNKEKSQELLKTPGVQFPDNLNSLTTNTIIRKAKAFVNNLDEGDENNTNKEKDGSNQVEQVQQVEQVEQVGIDEEQIRIDARFKAENLNQAFEEAERRAKRDNVSYVVIEWSESSSIALKDNTVMTFAEADKILQSLNEAEKENLGYYKTKLHIYCPVENSDGWYKDCRFDLGSEESGGLVRHMQEVSKYLSDSKERDEVDKFITNIQRELAHAAGLAFSDTPFDSLEDDNPYVYDGSMSVEDFKLMQSQIEQAEQVQQVEQAEQVINFDDYKIGEPLTIKSRVQGWDDWKTSEIKNKEARKAAEWLILNGYEEEQEVREAFYDRQTSKMADYITEAEKQDEAKILEVARKYKSKQVQQVEQVQTVGQAPQTTQSKKKGSITIPNSLVGEERGKSTKINMPDGEYSSFVFFTPTKFVQRDEETGEVQLSVNNTFKYVLMQGNKRVELTGSELRQAMAGQEIGHKAQRILSEENAQTLSDLYRNVPEEMRQYPNWCVYKTRWNEEKGKKDKQIYSPTLGIKAGKMQWASIDKPETWSTFDEAMKFAEENDCAGLVFALNGEGISCIDLDKSIVKDGKLNDLTTDKPEGTLSELAARLSDEMQGTYIETSASGNGIHIFVKDDILSKGKYKNRVETPEGEIEVYDERRFMSMTGNLRSKTVRLSKSPVATTQWLQKTLGKKVAENVNIPQPRRAAGQIDTSDSAVIERIRRSKKAAEFDALYRGDNVTGDNSRNDFKLLNMLAFFTDCDAGQMERIFESSNLYRPEKGKQYVELSVNKAISTLHTRMSDKALYGKGKQNGGRKGNSK